MGDEAHEIWRLLHGDVVPDNYQLHAIREILERVREKEREACTELLYRLSASYDVYPRECGMRGTGYSAESHAKRSALENAAWEIRARGKP